MIERREIERYKERYREGGRDKRERCKGYRERVKGRGTPVQGVRSRRKSSGNLLSGELKRKERLIKKKYDAITIRRNYDRKLSASIL